MTINRYLLLYISFLGVLACQKNVITVDGGAISGVPSQKEGVTVFKGIPYAAPPLGELRWRDPQPVQP